MIKITLGDIANNVQALNRIKTWPLNEKDSYSIHRLISRLEPISQSFNSKKDDLIKKYGVQDKTQADTWSISREIIAPEAWAEYEKKYIELMSIQEEVKYEKIKISNVFKAFEESRAKGEVVPTVTPMDYVDFVFDFEESEVKKPKKSSK